MEDALDGTYSCMHAQRARCIFPCCCAVRRPAHLLCLGRLAGPEIVVCLRERGQRARPHEQHGVAALAGKVEHQAALRDAQPHAQAAHVIR